MNIRDLKGLKYPDEAIIRFFFKEQLNNKNGKVIEFGCSNGNNLSLFYQYGYEIIGVDISKNNIINANFNFLEVYKNNYPFNFYHSEMSKFVIDNKNLYCDIFLIPNVISYISKEEFINFLEKCSKNNIFKKNAYFFLRTRTNKDYRYGRGKEINKNSFLIEDDSTNEKDCLCTFYEEHELIEILKKYLNLNDFHIAYLENQNYQNQQIILNADITIWGKIG